MALKGLLVACFIALPTYAAAEVYGDAAGCARHRGEAVATDSLYIYDLESVQRHESTCPVTAAQQVGAGATLLTVTCSGEGETWEDYYMVETTSDVAKLVIYPSDFPDFRTEISLCR